MVRLAGYAVVLIPTLCWGGGFVIIKVLLRDLTPFTVLVLRLGLGAVGYLILLLALGRGRLPWPRRDLGRLAFVGLAGTGLNMVSTSFAINLLGAGISSIVIMLVPVMTALLAVVAGQETVSARKIQGFLIAFAGLIAVVLFGGPGASFAGTQALGLVLMITAALGIAIYSAFAKPLLASYSPTEVTAYSGILSTMSLVPFVAYPPIWAELSSFDRLAPGGWLLAGWLGLFNNLLAFLAWYWALGRLDATRVAMFSYLIPIWGLIGAAVFLQERVTWWLPVGVALIVLGIAVTSRAATPAQNRV